MVFADVQLAPEDHGFKLIWDQEISYSLLPKISSSINQELMNHDPFCLWLTGSLGAGKTTLVGYLLHHLGLEMDSPVISPTYTLMNDYQIKKYWFAHLDLYRLTPSSLNLENFGLLDAHLYRGFFIEWPERALDDPAIAPTHLVGIDFVSKFDGKNSPDSSMSQDLRRIRLYRR